MVTTTDHWDLLMDGVYSDVLKEIFKGASA